MEQLEGKKILLLDGLTSQCLEYCKAFNALGCETTVLCDDKFDTAYASRHPKHKILGISNVHNLKGTEEWIITLVRSGKYDIVIPFTDYSAKILSHNKKELSKFAHLIVNDEDVFNYAQDKNNVMKVCRDNGIPCPMTFYDIRNIEDILNSGIKFPIIVKPRNGFGSHGFYKIENEVVLRKRIKENAINLSEMVIQEYLPKTSINVSENMFIDKNGKVQSSFTYACYRYYPIEGGSGVLNVTVDRPDVHIIAAKVSTLLNLRGLIDIDMIIDSRDDKPKVLEVNLRAAACAKVGFLAGINQAKQILEDLYGNYVTPMTEYKIDVRVRRSQIDWMWFLKSPDRFKTKPSWFDRKNTTDQLFSWSDPGPWFSFWIYGIKKILKERKKH